MPFRFDSMHRIDFANSTKMELQKLSPYVKCFDLKPLQEKHRHLQVVDFFEKVDEHFYSVFQETNYWNHRDPFFTD